MNYRTFGKLDWKPSALGFGTMRLPTVGEDPSVIDEQQAITMLRTGIDGGITYVDTAYSYHGGKSETLVGKALQEGYRGKVHLATKMPSWLIESQADMTGRFEEQLQRMQTDHVEFYLLHALDAARWHKLRDAGVLEWAHERIREGRIGHLGFSFHDTNTVFREIVDAYQEWTFCQIQYNFLDEETQAGTDGLHYAASRGLGIVVMEPLRGGKLAVPNAEISAMWGTASTKRSAAEWALDWVWNHPEVSLLLSGMSTLAQVQQNLDAAGVSATGMLAPGELDLIASVRDAYNALIRVPCTACSYCMPCPQGVNIPGMFQLVNEGSMFGSWDTQRKRYAQMKSEGSSADSCIRCGACEDKCPQHIAIRDELANVAEQLT
ncbi:aldo/keto reductase [Candidatus Cryosericum hinesii]|jgi:predicted aldo/keto reductase-like oxidoreductase|uniref:Aldo/keto reductase n=1 Tax=Candidatus Cryosericum hinesii TaxID=2290915 RepID=A0A398DB44_9BACT|nr:aldo/keto reductase [Candidatus Cryosericum hinesii]RIE08494.1 aldo/keto reductase [Candidatus Cryosericum hinesii]RIE11840.1 aldo/keto reductase [Candidatus Cryosericum hinesii]RIE12001.1 aldo/keto reductase [Candidatus Cryosericum hinesii]